jgi:hypothetical protein
MGFWGDMIPDSGWTKRGSVERAGQALTARRAAALSYTLAIRTCLLLSIPSIWPWLPVSRSFWWLAAICLAAIAAIFLADSGRAFEVGKRFDETFFTLPKPLDHAFSWSFLIWFVFAAIHFISYQPAVFDMYMESTPPPKMRFPFFFSFLLLSALSSSARLHVVRTSTDPRADLPHGAPIPARCDE